MDLLIPTIIILPLPFFGFWLWMFWNMTNNEYIQGNARVTWILAFIFLNIFAAFYYYLVEYRNRYL
jgi:hypothetical protein